MFLALPVTLIVSRNDREQIHSSGFTNTLDVCTSCKVSILQPSLAPFNDFTVS